MLAENVYIFLKNINSCPLVFFKSLFSPYKLDLIEKQIKLGDKAEGTELQREETWRGGLIPSDTMGLICRTWKKLTHIRCALQSRAYSILHSYPVFIKVYSNDP